MPPALASGSDAPSKAAASSAGPEPSKAGAGGAAGNWAVLRKTVKTKVSAVGAFSLKRRALPSDPSEALDLVVAEGAKATKRLMMGPKGAQSDSLLFTFYFFTVVFANFDSNAAHQLRN